MTVTTRRTSAIRTLTAALSAVVLSSSLLVAAPAVLQRGCG